MNNIKIENIQVSLELETKEEVIEYLCSVLKNNNYISNEGQFYDSVIEREDELSTGIGNGIAIPHGKSKAVSQSTVALAKLAKPINWDSHDGEYVDLVFLLAIEDKKEGSEHMRMLAELSAKLMDDDFILEIKEENDIDNLYRILGGVK